MLVVIGIILVVIGLAVPMVMRAWRIGDRTATFNDLHVIAVALDAYHTDHGEYPRVTLPWAGAPRDFDGARMLYRALVGPGAAGPSGTSGTPASAGPKVFDGKGSEQDATLPGPGFRLRGSQGRVYGPYISTDHFKTANPTTPGQLNPEPGFLTLLDRYGKPILYYPATGRPDVRVPYGFLDDYDPAKPPREGRAMYNAADNLGGMNAATFAFTMGDCNLNTRIDKPGSVWEEPLYVGQFMLWSAGPDEVFSIPLKEPVIPTKDPRGYRLMFQKCDDITNFRK